jgi:N-acetylglucosaminyl-diphospho-decaprenol L-rhamnosyltransferase
VHVVIPSYQGGEDLHRALQSIRASGLAPAAVTVVDNASTDGTVAAVRQQFPEVNVLLNSHNLGFGAACNRGLNLALEQGHELVLLLNQDAGLACDTLASMVDLASHCPRAGVVGCRTLSTSNHPDGSAILLYNGAWRFALPTLQKIPGIGGSSARSAGQPCQVDMVWGHAMLLRCQALREVGLFDEGFFMYYEDIDLCERLQRAGWQLWCDSRVHVWHAMQDGARARNSQLWRWRMKATSSRYFYRKRYPWFAADCLWLLSIWVESYWLLKAGHQRALVHLARAVWLELRPATSRP